MGYRNNNYQPVVRKNNHSQHYYPTTRRNNDNPFSSNLANNMRFGGKNNAVSGYVKREILMEDSKGNKKMAREIQFFNSAKNLGRIHIEE